MPQVTPHPVSHGVAVVRRTFRNLQHKTVSDKNQRSTYETCRVLFTSPLCGLERSVLGSRNFVPRGIARLTSSLEALREVQVSCTRYYVLFDVAPSECCVQTFKYWMTRN